MLKRNNRSEKKITLWNYYSKIKNKMTKLKNKVAVITGGNSGIGFSTAEKFIDEGAQVIITGRNEESLKKAVEQLGSNAKYLVSDSSSLEQNLNFAQQLKAIGVEKVDVFFYNAGVAQFAPVAETDVAVFEANLNTNFRGAYFTTQSLIPILNNGASIIFNTTVLGQRTMAGNAAYGASKAALGSLTKTLSIELASQKIRVNSLSPGAISTPIYSKLGMNEAQLNEFAAGFIPKIPLARFGNPEEIANAALFLASNESSYVTGSELTVDGGTSFQW
jgi:NAD(P)-dependent dehydrogenase (short-subunit alcohol dehydrogenase family)